jgi:hypothetical protein
MHSPSKYSGLKSGLQESLHYPTWILWRPHAGVMSAHMWGKIISVVTVQAPDRSSAPAVALAEVAEALRRPAAASSR